MGRSTSLCCAFLPGWETLNWELSFWVLPPPCSGSAKHKVTPKSTGSNHPLVSTACSGVKSASACLLRLTDSVFLSLPDGYTVEDIVLYWEGNGNAIQGTEKLQIPQFSFLGKTMTSKEVFFFTGGSDPFLLSCLLSPLYPCKLLGTSDFDLYTLLPPFLCPSDSGHLPKPPS